MSKDTYLKVLRKALAGVSGEAAQDLVLDIEQHFADGLASGRTEAEIAASLGSPQKMAAECKASLELDAFQQRRSLGGFLRLLRAIVGVIGFNLVLGGPALAAAVFCAVCHVAAVSVYLVGVLLVSSGLTGVERLAVANDAGHVVLVADGNRPVSATAVVDLVITKAGVSIVEPAHRADPQVTSADSGGPEGMRRGSNALAGILYVFAGILLWNLSIRLDRRAIVWLAGYVRLQRRVAGSVRTAVPSETAAQFKSDGRL